MRAAAILGLGCSLKNLKPFQAVEPQSIDWRIGLPAADDHADVILLFGGDGTIHRHLSQLVKLNLPVLVVPSGSGNDFARALGLRSVKGSLAAWRRFRENPNNVRRIDLGLITRLQDAKSSIGDPPAGARYFCTVAGIGLDAEVARRANRLPRWLRGSGGYALTLAPTIFRFAPFPMKIRTRNENTPQANDGSDWTTRSDQPTILSAFANTPLYGGGMKIAPRAQMDDGQFDVCVVSGVDPFKLFCMFPSVYFGRHLAIREVEYFRAGQARVETGHPLDVYADGEFVCQTPVEIAIEPGALKVIVP